MAGGNERVGEWVWVGVFVRIGWVINRMHT